MPDRRDPFDDLFGFRDDDFPDMRRHPNAGHTGRRHPMPCPPIAVLLAYADESDTSISPRQRLRIREHVHCCERCFAHVDMVFREELQGIAEMLRHDYAISRAETRRRETRFQEALREQVKQTTPPLRSHHRLTGWLSIAATIAALVAGLMWIRPAAAVIHAEELLEHAIASEREHADESRQARRVRQSLAAPPAIVLRPRQAASGVPEATPFSEIRDVVNGAFSTEMRLVNAREREAHAELARLFETSRFDWRRPFCLTCYRAWRASLPRKRDTVSVTGDMFVLRTTTSEGRLREVTLTISRDSYRIVRQTFLFEGLGQMAFEEIERQSAPAGPRASTALSGSASTASRAGASAAAAPISPLSSPLSAAGDPVRGAAPTQRMPLSRWLERTFPPSATVVRSTFLAEVARRSSSVRQHLMVLQRLASISASRRVKRGTNEERAKLRQQIELEYQAVITDLRALEERLNVMLGTGTRTAESRTTVPSDWQRRASAALPHARRLEQRLQRIFEHDDLPQEEAEPERPRSARATFEALWATIHGDYR